MALHKNNKTELLYDQEIKALDLYSLDFLLNHERVFNKYTKTLDKRVAVLSEVNSTQKMNAETFWDLCHVSLLLLRYLHCGKDLRKHLSRRELIRIQQGIRGEWENKLAGDLQKILGFCKRNSGKFDSIAAAVVLHGTVDFPELRHLFYFLWKDPKQETKEIKTAPRVRPRRHRVSR